MTETLTGKQVLALLAQDEVPEIEHQSLADGEWKSTTDVLSAWSASSFRATQLKFRIKPKPARRLSVTLASGEVVSWPEPEKKPLTDDQEYFFADPECQDGVNDWEWSDSELDSIRLKLGLVHLTREAAQEHADALRKINTQGVV